MARARIHKGQIAAVHALLGKMGRGKDAEFKEMLVKQYSGDRATSTKELYYEEAQELIRELNTQVGAEPAALNDLRARKMKYLYHLAHMMGWEVEELGKIKVDRGRLDGWCQNYGKYKKPLSRHSVAELSGVIYQLECAYKDYLRDV